MTYAPRCCSARACPHRPGAANAPRDGRCSAARRQDEAARARWTFTSWLPTRRPRPSDTGCVRRHIGVELALTVKRHLRAAGEGRVERAHEHSGPRRIRAASPAAAPRCRASAAAVSPFPGFSWQPTAVPGDARRTAAGTAKPGADRGGEYPWHWGCVVSRDSPGRIGVRRTARVDDRLTGEGDDRGLVLLRLVLQGVSQPAFLVGLHARGDASERSSRKATARSLAGSCTRGSASTATRASRPAHGTSDTPAAGAHVDAARSPEKVDRPMHAGSSRSRAADRTRAHSAVERLYPLQVSGHQEFPYLAPRLRQLDGRDTS